nr:CPCC family cysteine-rich protein [Janthinobacterium lividum]
MNEHGERLLPCPCCGAKTISEPGQYEICEVCNWEDDPVQCAEPDYAGGANHVSLNEARTAWRDRVK